MHQPEISELTSIAASYPEVRAALVDVQRSAFPGLPIVAEGRDMGTVIFPDAPLKFFLEVAPEVKLTRRIAQLSESKPDMSDQEAKGLKDKMKIEIEERDKRDAERDVSPTLPAEDAHTINNSSEELTRIVEKMYNMALERGLNSG